MTPEQQQSYIDGRWAQLSALTKDVSDRAAAYLLLTNSGGAVATLSFIGAVESIRSQYAPRIALALFALGLILVGVYTAMRVHYVDRLFAHWRRGVGRFYRGEIDWDTLTREDDERAYDILGTTWSPMPRSAALSREPW